MIILKCMILDMGREVLGWFNVARGCGHVLKCGSHKMRGILRLAEELVAFQGTLCIVSYFVNSLPVREMRGPG